jgi:hypothetical protein
MGTIVGKNVKRREPDKGRFWTSPNTTVAKRKRIVRLVYQQANLLFCKGRQASFGLIERECSGSNTSKRKGQRKVALNSSPRVATLQLSIVNYPLPFYTAPPVRLTKYRLAVLVTIKLFGAVLWRSPPALRCRHASAYSLSSQRSSPPVDFSK